MATGRSRFILAAAFALALLLTWGAAGAQEPPETGTRLEPGINLVGWVGEATSVSQLFDEIPQLESIWAWDAELRDWIVAGRGAPEWLGGLGRVTAGMGLRMQLGGDQPYLWRRSTEPTRGLVKLRTGWNLVAWSGADGTPIDDAVKGIGWSLRSVRRWNPTTQQWTSWTSPERSAQLIAAANADQEAAGDSAMPAIRRGEALWINVARAVNWLQPTDILPRLVFPGGASQQLQARVREDLEAVLAFYRDQYGIQADPDFTIYAAKDADTLIQAYKDDGQDVDDAYEASERALWNRSAGWAGADIVVKQSSWPEDLSTDEIAWARYTVTHEYFHILQRQLRDGSRPTDLLVEGTASWIDDEHKVFDGKQTWDDLRDGRLSAITDNTPTLRSVEKDNAEWEYTLGWLATDQLTANTAPDFPIEFWRQLAPTEIGPHGRWVSTPDWRTALHRVSGQTVSEFYTTFDVWQQEQAATNAATADSYEYDGNWIRGRVTGDGGAPVAGVFVNAIRVEGETSVGWNQRAETDADGSYAVQAPEAGDYRLSVDVNDDCTRYYSDGQLVDDGDPWGDWEEARPVKVSQSDVAGIDIRLPSNMCGWQIRGHVVGPDGEPLAGIPVSACDHSDRLACRPSTLSSSLAGSSVDNVADIIMVGTYTDKDGAFVITVPTVGRYSLAVSLGGCTVYFRAGGLTTNWQERSTMRVDGRDMRLDPRQIHEGMCAYQITGRVIQSDGQPLVARISACQEFDGECASWLYSDTDDAGAFAIIVPTDGRYRLSFTLDGCTVYFRPGGLTATFSEHGTVRVEGRSIRLSPRQIPEGMCGYQITGSITKADGQPLANTYVWWNCRGCDHQYGVHTDGNGAFAITVPTEGRYALHIEFDDCTIYFRDSGFTTDSRERSTVLVEGRNVLLAHRQIPAEMCAHRISGRLLKADGTPLANGWMNAHGPVGTSSLGAGTDANGRFEIRVPSDGAYRFNIQLREQPWCWHDLTGQVRVSGADVTDITLRLPDTIEKLCE